jgi:hypothetical protein
MCRKYASRKLAQNFVFATGKNSFVPFAALGYGKALMTVLSDENATAFSNVL